MKCLLLTMLAPLALLGAAPMAAAQSWPDRTVKIVVPFPAGGNVDVTTRIVARLNAPGAEPAPLSPAAFRSYLEKEDSTWVPLIRKLEIKSDRAVVGTGGGRSTIRPPCSKFWIG